VTEVTYVDNTLSRVAWYVKHKFADKSASKFDQFFNAQRAYFVIPEHSESKTCAALHTRKIHVQYNTSKATDEWLVFWRRIRFDIRPRDRLPRLRFFVTFLNLSKEMLG
jgi:hypothetical protein